MVKEYNSIYLGIVLQNNDPDKRGRVKVFVPHISPTIYNGWVESNVDKNFSFVGIIIYAIIYSYLITLGTRLFVSNSVILRQVSWTIAASIFYILRGPIDTMLIGFIVLFFYIGYVKKFVVNHQK